MQASSRLTVLAVVGLLVAGGAAFAIGMATASESETSDGAGVQEIDAPTAVSDTPALRDVGALPGLKEPPQSGSGGGTAAPEGSTPSETPSAPTEPPTAQPTPSEPVPSEPTPSEPVPPPPPGEG